MEADRDANNQSIDPVNDIHSHMRWRTTRAAHIHTRAMRFIFTSARGNYWLFANVLQF